MPPVGGFSGTHTSGIAANWKSPGISDPRGNANPRAATPMTVYGSAFRVSTRPMMCGSAPNRRRHAASLKYRDVIASRRLVGAFKEAADFRRDAKGLKEFSRRLDAIESFGIGRVAEVV